MFTTDTLKGRTALITGGGSGIGLEIATTYARLGALVMLVGRNPDRVESTLWSGSVSGTSNSSCSPRIAILVR